MTFQELQLAKESSAHRSPSVEKVYEMNMKMLHHLWTVDARHKRYPTKFFNRAVLCRWLKNFAKCLDSIIHADSMLAVNFQGFIKNVVEGNKESYESNQVMDKNSSVSCRPLKKAAPSRHHLLDYYKNSVFRPEPRTDYSSLLYILYIYCQARYFSCQSRTK
jgi:hypothetical protein